MKEFAIHVICVTIKQHEMKQHAESQHDRVCYSGDQCEYIATQKAYLKQYVESQHERIRHSCDSM